MNNIKSSQLFTLLISIKAFSVICMTDITDINAMLGTALSVLIQIVLIIPVIFLYKDPSFKLEQEKLFCKPVRILYILFFILWGAVSLSNLWEVTKSVYFPINSSLTAALILTAVCVYSASLGIKACFRASGFTVMLLLISLIIMFIGAYPQSEIKNIIPDININSILRGIVNDFCRSSELVMLFILLKYIPSKKQKCIFSFFSAKFILTEIVAFMEITVLGNLVSVSEFPFFSAGALSQPLSIQRADSVYMILFTILCIMTVTTQIVLSAIILNSMLPDLKYKSLISGILIITVSWFLNKTSFDINILNGGLIFILAFIIPLTILIRRKLNENKKNTVADSSACSS